MFYDKLIIRLIGLIPVATYRHELRTRYIDSISVRKFERWHPSKVRKNSVLIIEANPWHGEIVPGFAKYFQDLGFNVDVFLRPENNTENPFVNYATPDTPAPHIFVITPGLLKQYARDLGQYEHVFLSTSVFWDREFNGTVAEYLGYDIKCRGNVMMVEHSPQQFLETYRLAKRPETIFSLSAYQDVKRINPHYFGPIIDNRPKDNIVRFVVVGSIVADAKNHHLLIDAANDLINSGIDNFEINIVGRGVLDIPEHLKSKIKLCGRLAYREMFEKIQETDFLLVCLDPENPAHDRYKSGTTTGSLQLSFGFHRPMIISSEFANAYSLNDKNAIIYPGNELSNAMARAMKMTPIQYGRLVSGIRTKASDVYTESLNNLKSALQTRGQ